MVKSRTMQYHFHKVFKKISEKESQIFNTYISNIDEVDLEEPIVLASLSKCIELNIAMNSRMFPNDFKFLFIANLRGVAEELIVLSYFDKKIHYDKSIYFTHTNSYNVYRGLLAQKKFFQVNNPFQPVAGDSPPRLEKLCNDANENLNNFWKMVGKSKKPSIENMAKEIGLEQTYKYIYFLSSNFVHFNPHTLLRTGWGPAEGPFQFSIRNFSGYYADLASFYGALLFLGFYYRLGKKRFSEETVGDVENILKIINNVPRWPEIVTFEEMNQKRPDIPNIWMIVMRRMMQRNSEDSQFRDILKEIRDID